MMLLGFALVTSLACATAAYWMQVQMQRLRVQHLELAAGVAATLRELELLAAMNSESASRFTRMERDHSLLSERVGVLELRGESRPYDQAIDSARRGTDPCKLARQFGLSATEASLVTLLHGAKRLA